MITSLSLGRTPTTALPVVGMERTFNALAVTLPLDTVAALALTDMRSAHAQAATTTPNFFSINNIHTSFLGRGFPPEIFGCFTNNPGVLYTKKKYLSNIIVFLH